MAQVRPFRSGSELEATDFRYAVFNGGSGGGGMEARVARLESNVEHIMVDVAEIKADIREMRTGFTTDMKELRGELKGEMNTLRSDLRSEMNALRGELKGEMAEMRRDARTDFRLTFAALASVAIGLAAIMAKGFGWIG